MRDSASLGKHIILQQDQKQRKPDNKSLGFHRMFTGKLAVFCAELGLKIGFVSKFADSCTYFADSPENTRKTAFWKEVAFSWIETPCALWEKIKKLRSPKNQKKKSKKQRKELLPIKI